MARHVENEQQRRLLELWRELTASVAATASLSELTSRDLAFFRHILKDSFVVRGGQSGPFSTAFVGTDLEVLFGRKLHTAPFGFGLPAADVVRIEEGFVGMLKARRPMLMSAELTSSKRTDRIAGGILCVPLVGETCAGAQPRQDEAAAIFGLFAFADCRHLPPDPTHPHIAIKSTALL